VPGNAEDPIVRAERALATLEGQFPVWLQADLDRLSSASETALAHGLTGEPKAVLYRAAHDVRGQAATLGYPLAGRLADSLCLLLDQVTDRRIPSTLVDQHVAAIRAIVNERARDDGTPVARELVTRLIGVTDEFIRTVRRKRRRQSRES
jgi:HPt (histidine-containing phosphotransfer) domain-containing protein